MKDNLHFSGSVQHTGQDIYLMAIICSKFIDKWFEYIIPNSIFHVYILNKQQLSHTMLDKTIMGDHYVTTNM